MFDSSRFALGDAELVWEVAKETLDDIFDIFRWFPRMLTREVFEKTVAQALVEEERGESVVFAPRPKAHLAAYSATPTS